ncbi:acyl-CoA carboxylase subunit epsilon [Streptomyces sp. NBC_01304]|uniref:acyl-CoA carboxylase subunit epsilon n=1 Tax=Streptomyces sp. NBC_01304 TaxID=2903818 RepID=UPI002E128A09|nr:acyl-CoA carboxylase subunit epsilon [Streptomyces sp. NBC_01304]
MDNVQSAGDVVRVERGQVQDEELAAVTAALLSLLARYAADREDGQGERPHSSSWGRWDRTAGYRAPRSWQ